MNMFEIAKEPKKMFDMFAEMFPKIARDLYKDPVVKKLYERKDEFDLVIIDAMFNEVGLHDFIESIIIVNTTNKISN